MDETAHGLAVHSLAWHWWSHIQVDAFTSVEIATEPVMQALHECQQSSKQIKILECCDCEPPDINIFHTVMNLSVFLKCKSWW